MNCPHCGHELPDDATFCPDCGNKIQATPANGSPTQQVESAPEAQKQGQGKRRNPQIVKVVAIVVGAFLVVGCIVAVVVALGTRQDVNTPPVTRQEPELDSEPDPEPEPEPEQELSDEDLLLVDRHGYATLFAVTELDGESLYDVIQDHGYDLVDMDGSTFFSPDSVNYALVVYIGAEEEPADFQTLRALDTGGANTEVWYDVVVAGYDSVEDALETMGNVTFTKYTEDVDDISSGIIKASDGGLFLFAGYISESGNAVLQVYNEKSITSGSLAYLGSTIEDVYKSLSTPASNSGETIEDEDSASLDNLAA